MAILDTVFFGFVALLLGFKVFLLAAATVLLFMGMGKRISKQQSVTRQGASRKHRLDVYA